jgi:hypothetical protein
MLKRVPQHVNNKKSNVVLSYLLTIIDVLKFVLRLAGGNPQATTRGRNALLSWSPT